MSDFSTKVFALFVSTIDDKYIGSVASLHMIKKDKLLSIIVLQGKEHEPMNLEGFPRSWVELFLYEALLLLTSLLVCRTFKPLFDLLTNEMFEVTRFLLTSLLTQMCGTLKSLLSSSLLIEEISSFFWPPKWWPLLQKKV